MSDDYSHTPVLAARCFELLKPALTSTDSRGAGNVYIDTTLGLGGHSNYFLKRLPDIKVIGVDRDVHALSRAITRLAEYEDRFFPFHGSFADIEQAWELSPWSSQLKVKAILADFGVSSMQLDNPERGFSYTHDGPLDMRMDTTQGITCAQLIAEIDRPTLTRILREYGDEKFAASISGLLTKEREIYPIETTSLCRCEST